MRLVIVLFCFDEYTDVLGRKGKVVCEHLSVAVGGEKVDLDLVLWAERG
jgi:hypothetical protein